MRSLPLLLLAAALATPVAFAQESDEPPAVQMSVAPAETREVIAEGRAAIAFSAESPGAALLAARKAATAQALRAAVEKALGVYVSARTLASNYQLVKDSVTTRAEGFATLKEVLSEKVGTQEVRVTVRALVSLRPLAKELKELGLTRAWRVYVAPAQNAEAGVAALEKALGKAGFAIVESAGDADIEVRLAPKFTRIAARRLRTAAGEMTMHTVRGELVVRAVRARTSDVVATLSARETELHIHEETAGALAVEGAAGAIAPRLTDALLVLPGALSQPVTLKISGLSGASQATALDDALAALPGVQGAVRRSYAAGTAVWELDAFSEALSRLGRDLESLPGMRLSVTEESRTRLVARVKAR